MASSRIITTLTKIFFSSSSSSSNLIRCGDFRRGYSSSSSYITEQIAIQTQGINKSLAPSTVALQTSFSAPDNRDIHASVRTGSGIFVEPNIILTSAHLVARIATSYESKPVAKKPDRLFEQHGSILHKSYIGDTFALALRTGMLMLETKPLAVSFIQDLAVLEVVKQPDIDEAMFPGCKLVAHYPDKDEMLLTVARYPDCAYFGYGTFRATGGGGKPLLRAKAPWPLDEEKVMWMEIDLHRFPSDPPLESDLFDCSKGGKIGGLMCSVDASIGGSPWYNLNGEVVGISSWRVKRSEEETVRYAVPSVCFKGVLEYAKTKRPDDPVVMDRWIDGSRGGIPGVVDQVERGGVSSTY